MKIPMFRSILFSALLCISIGQAMANDAELSLNATNSGDGNRKSSRSIESEPIEMANEATNTPGFSGGETMLIANMPNAVPSAPPVVMVAQVNSSQQVARQTGHVLGICDVANVLKSGQVEIMHPVYLHDYSQLNGENKDYYEMVAVAKVTIVKQPAHGNLDPGESADWLGAKYLPNDGYVGNDSFMLQVDANGYKVTLHYFIAVTNDFGVTTNPNPLCKGQMWKISQDADGNQVLTLLAQPASTAHDTTPNISSLDPLPSLNPTLSTFLTNGLRFAQPDGRAAGAIVGASRTVAGATETLD